MCINIYGMYIFFVRLDLEIHILDMRLNTIYAFLSFKQTSVISCLHRLFNKHQTTDIDLGAVPADLNSVCVVAYDYQYFIYESL